VDLPLALLGWHYEGDLVGARARPIIEVGGVRSELRSKATGLLGTAIPLEVDQHLAIRRQEPAPPVWDRRSLIAFGVRPLHAVFADPVIEAKLWQAASRCSEVDEELVRLQLVDQMEPPLERMLGASHKPEWFDIEPFREGRRTPPR
jgi:hypothetical protein